MSIRGKLFLFLIVLVLFITVSNVAVIGMTLNKRLTNELLDRVSINTQSVVDTLTNFVLTENRVGAIDFVFNEKYSRKDLAYMIVFDEHNTIVASTLIGEDFNEIFEKELLPVAGKDSISLLEDFHGNDVYDISVPLGYGKGVLRSGYLKDQIDVAIFDIVFVLLIVSFISLLVVLVFALFFARQLFKPLAMLNETVSEVAGGDFSKRATVQSKDEIGNFAKVFNQMLDTIEKSREALEDSEKNLEKVVDERTRELKKKVIEMKEFERVTIGRELKMIELKKKIKELEKKEG